jgi:hypothetical protein
MQDPIPRSLYFTNKAQPRLSDLREAIRANTFLHDKFNPSLEGKALAYYKPALEAMKSIGDESDMLVKTKVYDLLLKQAYEAKQHDIER